MDATTGAPPHRALTGKWELRRSRAVLASVIAMLSAYTAVTWALPPLRVSLVDPGLRVTIEVLEMCAALFAATALWVEAEEPVDPAHNAFIAALVALAGSNAVFVLAAMLLADELPLGRGVGFYAWLTTRYAAGVLFILATGGRPQLRVRSYLVGIGTGLAIAVCASTVLGPRLPQPYLGTGESTAVLTTSNPVVVAVVFGPALLFSIGAWMAWRAFARSASRIYFWLSLALWVQVASKVHELLYPTLLGRRATSSDLLRMIMVGLLLFGALQWLRRLSQGRRAAVAAQERDLRAQEQLLSKMSDFTDREQAFRSIVVHELATPIVTLRAFIHTIAKYLHEQAPPHAHAALQGIRSETARLQQLVARMEELRTLELAEFDCQLRPTRLRPLLEDVATYAQGLPGGHAVVISCDEVTALADPLRLGQALRNLATNAARYSPPGSPIVLECRESAPGHVHVGVLDRGPGVPTPERQRVLGKYQRGSSGRQAEGTGLGLYIVRRIAEAHDGRLYILDADEGAGARVVIELRQVPR